MAMKIEKILSCICVVVILMSVVPVSVFAVDGGTRNVSGKYNSFQDSNEKVSSMQGGQEVKFIGTAIEYHEGLTMPGDWPWWKVSVDEIISGPSELKGHTVIVSPGVMDPGYMDPNIKSGDKVKVYGEYQEVDNVWIDRSNYYITKEEQKPDLIIQDISWNPSNPDKGDTVTFTVKIKNQGSGSAGSSTVKYYIDGTYVASDSVPSLSAGSTSTQKFTWTANKCGDVKVKAVADATSKVSESNEGNNCRTETVNVACDEKPDLIIQDIYWSPSSPDKWDTIKFTVKIKNQGSGSAGSSTVKYYIDGTYVTSDSVPSLSAGSTSTQTFTWTVNKCGNVRVKAVADATSKVSESNEGNNERTEMVNVACDEKPDLIIQDISYWSSPPSSPPNPNPNMGDTVTFSVSIKNQGSGSAGSSTVKYYIDGSYVDSDSVTSLSAGSTSTQTFTWTAIKCGKVHVKTVADATSKVSESNEGNNERTVTVNVACDEKPDLVIQDIYWSPQNPKEGDEITFYCLVKNKGKASAGSSTVELNHSFNDGGYMASSRSVPALAAGDTATIQFSITWTLYECGDLLWRVIADADNEVKESNEANNVRTETMSVICNKPDLVIESISWSPSNPKKGDTITFTVKTKNKGDGDADAFYIYYYIDEFGGGGYMGNDYVSGGLEAGKTKTTSFSWEADKCGNVQMKAWADATDQVDEGSNEGDNTKTKTVNVECPEKKTGTLTVTIYPSDVRSNGRWKLTSGPDTNWHSNGDTITNIPVGPYTIQYKDVSDWTKPSDKAVTITEGTNSESGTYTKKSGTLTVTIYPSYVQSNGRWKLTSGPDTNWHSSGDTVSNIPVGSYTIQFKDVSGWTKPSDKTVTITEGSNSQSGTYTPEEAKGDMSLLWKKETADLVLSVSVSENGEYIAIGSKDTYVYYFNKLGDLIWKHKTNGAVNSVSTSNDGNYVIAGSDDYHIYYFDKSGFLWKIEVDERITTTDISSDGRYSIAGSWSKYAYFFDNQDPNKLLWKRVLDVCVGEVSISDNGEYIAIGGGCVYLLDKYNTTIWEKDISGGVVDISGDGNYVIVGADGYTTYVYHKSGKLEWKDSYDDVHDDHGYRDVISIGSVSLSTDGSYSVVGSYGFDVTIRSFDKTGKVVWRIKNDTYAVDISGDGHYIAAGVSSSEMGESVLYIDNFDDGNIIYDYSLEDHVWVMDLSKDGKYFAAAAKNTVYFFGPRDVHKGLDDDGDGVINLNDKCKNTPGPACNDGCPTTTDADNDGLQEDNPSCPNYDVHPNDHDNDGITKDLDCDDNDPTNACQDSVLISNFPNLFHANSYLVVGENAASIDMIGGIRLINELAYTGSSIVPMFNSEVSGDTTHNILSIGGPMANSVTANLNDDMGISLSSDATKYTISISGWKSFDVPKSWEGSEDLAVVAVREVGDKKIMVVWGITGQGTWAASEYISEPDIRSQLKTDTAIIHWKDVDGDTSVSPDDIVELYDSNSANGNFATNSLQLTKSEFNHFSSSPSRIIQRGEKVLIIVGKESGSADHKGTYVLSQKLGENGLKCSTKVDDFLLTTGFLTMTWRNFFNKHKLVISVGGPIPNKYTERMNKIRGVTWEQNGNIFKITIDGKTFSVDTSEKKDDIAIIYRAVAGGAYPEMTREVIVVWGSKQYGTEKACEYLAGLDINSIDKMILKIDDGSINTNNVVSREFQMKALISESIYRYYSFVNDNIGVWKYFINKFTPLNIAFETLCEITGLGTFSNLGSMAKDLGYSEGLSEYIQDTNTLSSHIYVDVGSEYGFDFISFKDNLKTITESYNEGKTPDKDLLINIYTNLKNINEITNTKYENEIRIKRFNKLAMTFIEEELETYYQYTEVEGRCPVNIHAYDQYGRHVGVNLTNNSKINLQIPDAYYSGPDSHPEIITIYNDSLDVRFFVDATGDGTFNLTVTKKNGTDRVIAEYLDIPITNDSNAILNVYSKYTDDRLYLDSAGDKFYKSEISPDSVTVQEAVSPFLDNITHPYQIELDESVDIEVSIGDESMVENADILMFCPSGYSEKMPMNYISLSGETGYNVSRFTYTFSNTSEIGSYEFYITCEDIYGNSRSFGAYSFGNSFGPILDTKESANQYPSISGTHTGTITPSQDVNVSKLYTYPCAGTGGHTESVRIYGNDLDESASWDGYAEDGHTITFDSSFILEAGKTYNYVIETGSYPQIHHTAALQTYNGWLNCTKFTDANGKEYDDWIPAIRLGT